MPPAPVEPPEPVAPPLVDCPPVLESRSPPSTPPRPEPPGAASVVVHPPVDASDVGASPLPALPPRFPPPSPLTLPPVFPPPSPLVPPADVALPVEGGPSAGFAPPPSNRAPMDFPPVDGDEKSAFVSPLPQAVTVRRTTERQEKCSRSRRMGRKPFQTSMNDDCFPRCRDRTRRINRSRERRRGPCFLAPWRTLRRQAGEIEAQILPTWTLRECFEQARSEARARVRRMLA
jgi:hypothetical protein